MSLNTVSSIYATSTTQGSATLSTVYKALQDGDLAKAQNAYVSANLPAMSGKNTTPLGLLYNALKNGDLASAQKAALTMQGKSAKGTTTGTSTSGTSTSGSSTASKTASTSTGSKTQSSTASSTQMSAASFVQATTTNRNSYNLFTALSEVGSNVNAWG